MAKAPAFQFYASDFLTDTQSWEIEEVGIYIRLLSNEWVNGPLPSDEKRLARIAGCDFDVFKNHWVIVGFKFLQNEQGFFFNERLEEIRDEQEAKRLKNAENGSKGGRPRKSSENKPKENPEETQRLTQIEPNDNPKKSPSSSSSTSYNNINKEGGLFFKIGNDLFKGKPSDRIISDHATTTDHFMMTLYRGKGLTKEAILERLDNEYVGYSFNDEMHLRNSFKTVADKIIKESKPKTTYGRQESPADTKGFVLGAKPTGAVNHGK